MLEARKKPEWVSQYVAQGKIKESDMTARLVFTLIQNIFILPAGCAGPGNKSGGFRKSAETSESHTQQLLGLEGVEEPQTLID